MTNVSERAMIWSASIVVGPLAPSARMRQLTREALSPVMTRSRAQGASTVQGVSEQLGVGDNLRFREVFQLLAWRHVTRESRDVDPPDVLDRAIAIADGDDLRPRWNNS